MLALVLAAAPRAASAAGDRPAVVASSAAGCIAADERDVVWGNDGGVFRASGDGKGGQTAGTRVSDVVASALALDRGALYIAAASGDIWRLPRWGGGAAAAGTSKPQKLASTDVARALALDERHVYWTGSGTVFRVAKAGGPIELVASVPGAMIFHLAVDGSHAYFTVLRGPDRSGVLRTSTRDVGRGGNLRVPAVETVVERVQPSSLTLDDTHVYVALAAGAGAGGVVRVPKAASPGGAPRAVATIARGLHSPWDLLVAGGFLYVLLQEDASGRGGAVMRVPAGGGEIQVLADRQRGLVSLVRGGQRLYWGASADGDRAGASAQAALLSLAIPQPAVCNGAHIDLDTILGARACDVPWPRKAIEVPPPTRLETRLEPARPTAAPGQAVTLELSFVNVTPRPLPLTVGVGGADDAFAAEVIDAGGKRADRPALCPDQIGSAYASRAIAVVLAPGGRLVKRVDLAAVAAGCDASVPRRPLPRGSYRLRVHTPFRLRAADATGIAEGELVVR